MRRRRKRGAREIAAVISCALAGAWLTLAFATPSPVQSARPTEPVFPITPASFESSLDLLERAVAGDSAAGAPRDELLVRLGRNYAANGQYDLSAAAYVVYCHEYGRQHPLYLQVLPRLVQSLAPLKLDSVDITHTEDGPRSAPCWQMGASPSPTSLGQAVALCNYAAAIAEDRELTGAMLLHAGWVWRALGDWQESTSTWLRCAEQAGGARAAADALWLAAENLLWNGQPAEAAGLMRRFAAQYPQDPRVAAASERMEHYQAEAGRGPEWLQDPVASLQAEISRRQPQLSAAAVYRSATDWLIRKHKTDARILIARWATTQHDWPAVQLMQAHGDLVDALLSGAAPEAARITEAIDVLGRMIELAPTDAWRMSAALRQSRLLRETGQAGRARSLWEEVSGSLTDHDRWVAQVLPERIRVLLATGDGLEAARLLTELERALPEHPELSGLRDLVRAQREEGV